MGGSQIQLHSVSRPGHAEFNVIYWQLMDIMWPELSVNTRVAENWDVTQKQEVWLQWLSLVIPSYSSIDLENQFFTMTSSRHYHYLQMS